MKAWDTCYYIQSLFAVVGNQTLDEIEELVRECFNNVVNKNVTPSLWEDHPYDVKENGGTITQVVPIKDIRVLNMSFPIPDYQSHYKRKPVSYSEYINEATMYNRLSPK